MNKHNTFQECMQTKSDEYQTQMLTFVFICNKKCQEHDNFSVKVLDRLMLSLEFYLDIFNSTKIVSIAWNMGSFSKANALPNVYQPLILSSSFHPSSCEPWVPYEP